MDVILILTSIQHKSQYYEVESDPKLGLIMLCFLNMFIKYHYGGKIIYAKV